MRKPNHRQSERSSGDADIPVQSASARPVPCSIPIRVDAGTGQLLVDPATGTPVYERFLMTRKQVMGYLGVSSNTIDRLVSAGTLARPVKINGFTARWFSDEVASVVDRLRDGAR
jgi:predicted DNA-binding transcriptional regulator AlpA